MPAPPSLEDRFQGCLVGLAIGDALGMMVYVGIPKFLV